MYITNGVIPEEWSIDMTQWICRHQNSDGGWGLHVYGKSSLFPTVLSYVSLRILGIQAAHAVAVKAKQLIHEFGESHGY